MVGDLADMESLNGYDKKGSAKTEGRRIQKDIDAAKRWMEMFESNLRVTVDRKWFTCGNHDKRLDRFAEEEPRLQGIVGTHQIKTLVEDYGYSFHDFMVVAPYDGIYYSHLFHATADGKPSSTSTYKGFTEARNQLKALPVSTVAGHHQGYSCARYHGYGPRIRGRFAVIAGSFYQHREDYLGPNGNSHMHCIVDICGIRNGNADRVDAISLTYLRATYGKYKS